MYVFVNAGLFEKWSMLKEMGKKLHKNNMFSL